MYLNSKKGSVEYDEKISKSCGFSHADNGCDARHGQCHNTNE